MSALRDRVRASVAVVTDVGNVVLITVRVRLDDDRLVTGVPSDAHRHHRELRLDRLIQWFDVDKGLIDFLAHVDS